MPWYQWCSIIVAVMSLLGVGTIFSMFWKDRHDIRQQNSTKEMQRKKDERIDEMRTVFSEGFSPLEDKVDALGEKLDLINKGTLGTLRNDILEEYYKCQEKGYRNDYDYQNFMELYSAYHSLGGNCFVEDIKGRFEKLPSKEDYKAALAQKKVAELAKKKQKIKDKKEV